MFGFEFNGHQILLKIIEALELLNQEPETSFNHVSLLRCLDSAIKGRCKKYTKKRRSIKGISTTKKMKQVDDNAQADHGKIAPVMQDLTWDYMSQIRMSNQIQPLRSHPWFKVMVLLLIKCQRIAIWHICNPTHVRRSDGSHLYLTVQWLIWSNIKMIHARTSFQPLGTQSHLHVSAWIKWKHPRCATVQLTFNQGKHHNLRLSWKDDAQSCFFEITERRCKKGSIVSRLVPAASSKQDRFFFFPLYKPFKLVECFFFFFL